ncbi:integral peroxisomal membrane peroxin-domain-containing protein [Lentinula edodes]|uniref:integral peroxisomal membrane peroxin-domain-containing protein n=1 Tax=Lentinula edodes TaxID=5353 RepID=UPI001E8CF57B|nr:integral peroxisomal membrane peroxin-domain-containing protein [Lentinula edodes]KAH7876231.1 integral peroxisomal membrane peroxin-domain-containing protein [Lentinula edodes]
MATLDYISIPSCASRLKIHSSSELSSADESDIRPAPKLRTNLPRPTSESSEGPTSPLKGFAGSSALNLLPNLLLSSSLPSTSVSDPTFPSDSKSNPGRKRFKKLHQEPIVLLSNKDPLSIQITSVNFKRFIERVGPVFWLQDRLEEIVFWRRGSKVTGTWLAVYCFLCYIPRLVFLLPHVILIAIILASVHYPPYKPPPPSVSFSDHTSAATPTDATTDANYATPSTAGSSLPAPVAEDSVDWQANIQAIQNLMGLYADIHIAITPYLSHLSLSPNDPQISKPKSPYTLPILTVLILSFPILVFLVTSTIFPARLVCFVCGAGPVLFLNPQLRQWTSDTISLLTYLQSSLPDSRYSPIIILPIPPIMRRLSFRLFGVSPPSQITLDSYSINLLRKRVKMRFQRILDDNNLSNDVWISEMREVELWENERLDPGITAISANLTFSLAPNWEFVPTEDWRADLVGDWIREGWVSDEDEDGWIYTNDVWLVPADHAYSGAVTRRRRWVRRIWYNSGGGSQS